MAQLFISSYILAGATIQIIDQAFCHQITRVLRMQLGDFLFVQPVTGSIRYKIVLTQIKKDSIIGTIEEMYANPDPELSKRVLYVALPNKREKAELIVQKAAEIGITELVFRSAQRSLLKELPEKKKERMETIVREATEQSWGWSMMQVSYYPMFPQEDTQHIDLVVFDYHAEYTLPGGAVYTPLECGSGVLGGIVGPEGGFTPEERRLRNTICCQQVSLGETVLRTETAAIIGAWRLRHNG